MKIIKPSVEIMACPSSDDVYSLLEEAGRTCYKSENMMNATSAESFCQKIIRSGHMSVIEHVSITVRIICDRGVTHELVRHRLCSFSQESTRYANYSKDKFGNEITVIKPLFWEETSPHYWLWRQHMEMSERAYLSLIDKGATAQEARSVLPNSLKTEIVMTANIREWRHILKLRCSPASHPQMREIMNMVGLELSDRLPGLFGGGI